MQNSPWYQNMNSKIFSPRKPAKPEALVVIRKEQQDPNLAGPLGWLSDTMLIIGENFSNFSNMRETRGFYWERQLASISCSKYVCWGQPQELLALPTRRNHVKVCLKAEGSRQHSGEKLPGKLGCMKNLPQQSSGNQGIKKKEIHSCGFFFPSCCRLQQ